MSKKEKLLKKFLSRPIRKDLTFDELTTLLVACGYIKLEGAGSAVKFYHKEKESLISLHKLHPCNVLKVYLVKQIQIKLQEICDE
jgi:hypothetical protein